MATLIDVIRSNPLLWLLIFVPAAFAGHSLGVQGIAIFCLSVLAIIPLAALLSLATEQVARRTGDTVGGLLNATLGNLTELIIALSALKAGQYMLVKASLAGVIVTNMLFMTGASLLLGGVVRHVQEFNLGNARLNVSMLFVAAVGLLIPSAVASADFQVVPQSLSLAISLILILGYLLVIFFTLGTHREIFSATAHHAHDDSSEPWPFRMSLVLLAAITVAVAGISEIFVSSLEAATHVLGISPAFVGFVVVALVGAAAEMAAAFSAARANRLDLSLSISFGSATQIALFVAPMLVLLSYVIGPQPMSLQFWPGAIVMIFVAVFTAAFVSSSGRSAWFLGALMLMVYAIFAVTLLLLPPGQGGGL